LGVSTCTLPLLVVGAPHGAPPHRTVAVQSRPNSSHILFYSMFVCFFTTPTPNAAQMPRQYEKIQVTGKAIVNQAVGKANVTCYIPCP
jgi:hypothetical protein